MVLLLARVAHAFRPTDGTDAGVADPGAVEVQLAPLEVRTTSEGSEVAGPVAAVAVGLGGGFEAGLVGGVGAAGAAIKRRIAATPSGVGVAVEVAASVFGTPEVGALLAVSLPGSALTLHLDGGSTVDATGALRGVGLALVEGPALGPITPVAELAISDGTGPLSLRGLGGLVASVGAVALDAAVAVDQDGPRRSSLVRGGVTVAFGPPGGPRPDALAQLDEPADAAAPGVEQP